MREHPLNPESPGAGRIADCKAAAPAPGPVHTLPLHQVDAFTDRVFGGNPAAVCPLPAWLPDATMQQIAAENALSETAFFVPAGEGFHIRWFTPDIEVDLCGHATLAAAHVIVRHLHPDLKSIRFQSMSGELMVHVDGDWLTLDFPARAGRIMPAGELPAGLLDGVNAPVAPSAVLKARDYLLVFEDEDIVRQMQPRHGLLLPIDMGTGGVIVTAPGRDVDFVSRFFAPSLGIPEDPVTGSAHCTLVPYWRQRLGKTRLLARQVSARGGLLRCTDLGERVHIAGQAVTYLEGRIRVPA